MSVFPQEAGRNTNPCASHNNSPTREPASLQPETMLWWASFEASESWYRADSVEDAMREAARHDYEYIVISRNAEELDPGAFLDAERVFEQFEDSLENCPYDEDWQSYWGATREQFRELTDAWRLAFKQWHSKHKFPTYYTISTENLERVSIYGESENSPEDSSQETSNLSTAQATGLTEDSNDVELPVNNALSSQSVEHKEVR